MSRFHHILRRVWFLLFVLGGMFAASGALAQSSQCADRATVHFKLADTYGESRVGVGLQNETRVFEVWANLETGTWTILLSMASGTSCVMASGINYREFDTATQLEPSGTDS